MFPSRGRARGRRTVHRLAWNRLQVHSLESRIAPAQLVVTSAADDGEAGTLRSVLAVANTNGEADTITFDSAVTSITLMTGQLLITENQNLSIDGGGTVTINGADLPSDTNRLFNITSIGNPTISMMGLTLAKGNVTGSYATGGAIRLSDQVLVLSKIVFSNNEGFYGGAVATNHNTSGNEILLQDCTFTGNTALIGGGIYVSRETTLTVISSQFSNNFVYNGGGAIYAEYAALDVVQSTFTNNNRSAIVCGGTTSSASIRECVFSDNLDNLDIGGGIEFKGDAIEITNTSFFGNRATRGGAVAVYSSFSIPQVTMAGCLFSDNYADLGGAISVGENSPFSNYLLTMTDCTIRNNDSAQGGGMSISGKATVQINTTSFLGNHANGRGGGIDNGLMGGTVTITNSTIANNWSGGVGGGLCVATDAAVALTIQNSTVARNQSLESGGGLCFYFQPAMLQLDSNIISGNISNSGPDISSTSIVFKGNNNLIGAGSPGLLWIDENGGPTETMALAYNSPAINSGNNVGGWQFDQRGQPREVPTGQPDIGAVEGIGLAPFVASIGTFPKITVAGATSYLVSVSFDSPNGINSTSVDSGDIVVSGPRAVDAISVANVTSMGNRILVDYKITPPGGSWDDVDVGSYTVSLAQNGVLDKSTPSIYVPAQPLGRFKVAISGKFVVSSALDINDGNYSNGNLTLREAFQLANTDTTTTDTISFDPTIFAVPSTIVLNSELSFEGPVNIDGPGANLVTLSGNNVTRIMTGIGGVTAFKVQIKGLTIADGYAPTDGGAMLINSQLVSITDCVFSKNASLTNGGAIALNSRPGVLNGSLSIVRSTFNENQAVNGGAVCSDGFVSTSITINSSAFTGNSATEGGGGIFVRSNLLRMSNSQISGNMATNGAALFIAFGSNNSFVENTTISNNAASNYGGGIYNNSSSVVLLVRNTTITGNSAGVLGGGFYRAGGTASIDPYSSIIAGNTGGDGPDLAFGSSTSISAFNTLIGIADFGNFTVTGPANLLGTKAAPLDAKLGPLTNNGGPTLTHALLPGSPAINAGSNTAKLATDQRGTGFARVVGGQADIGAFEVQAPPPRALSFHVNDGSPQRSLLTSFKVSFSEAVLFPNGASTAFELTRTGPGTPNGIVSINAVASGPDVTITFVNGGAIALDPGSSLPDGRYQLSIIANKIIGAGGFLDGNGNGIPGDNAVFTTHRLFGDSNGDGTVSAFDYNAFRTVYSSTSPVFDFNNDGVVSAADFQQFRLRYRLLI